MADPAQPASLANGRCKFKQLLAEGGKKRFHLVHDIVLNRDVAPAVIKPVLSIAEGTKGLIENSRSSVAPET